ncbi:MAG: GRP family sugar transporter [Thermoguttaceae bacterium]
MFVLETYAVAVVFCVITMLCWGSWANTQKLASSRWRFELFYWDYVFGVLLMAILFAFTLGNWGQHGRSFLDDLRQADAANLGSALLGGVIFNAANILLVAAIALSGMSVAFPVGIGMALVIGVFVNYWGDPIHRGNPILLFLGVAFIAAAIILDALAYRKVPGGSKGGGFRGLILAVLCGVSMGYFYKIVVATMSNNFMEMREAGKLSPYTAMVFFSLGVLVSQFAYNFSLILQWFTGTQISRPGYFAGGVLDHVWGIVGGMIWAVGMMFSLIAFGKAGPAISYGLGQGATLVAAFWGVFIWREFRTAPPSTKPLIWLMFAGYLIGLALLICAGA